MSASLTVKHAGIQLPLYHHRGRRHTWTLAYYFDGQRRREKFTHKRDETTKQTLKRARDRAKEIARAQANREPILDLKQKIEFSIAYPIAARHGKTLPELCLLGEKYLEDEKRRTVPVEAKRIPEIVTEFLELKTRKGRSAFYLGPLRGRLDKFGEAFNVAFESVRAPDIEAWLRKLGGKDGVAPKTHNHYLAAVRALAAYAKSRQYLTAAWDEARHVEPIETPLAEQGPVGIFTPAQLVQLVNAANDKILPHLVLGAFAGIRSEEIGRMRWRMIDLKSGYIEMPKYVTKTKRARQIPILPNLEQWLRWMGEKHGAAELRGYRNYAAACRKLATSLGLPWERNGLRHSFISYRVAQTQDIAQVALEAGNSVSEIHAGYLKLVTPEEADKWFSISPSVATQQILQLKFA
jgi:integrase